MGKQVYLSDKELGFLSELFFRIEMTYDSDSYIADLWCDPDRPGSLNEKLSHSKPSKWDIMREKNTNR